MIALVDYTQFGGSASETPSLDLRTNARIGKMIRDTRRRWHDAQIGRSVRGLEGLNEHLLKDIGLFREHLPSGAVHFRRR